MKKKFVFGVLFTGIALSSCGGNTEKSSTLNENAKIEENKPAEEKVKIEENKPVEEKEELKACVCCGREFINSNGWDSYERFGGGIQKSSNNKNCSKRCASECPL
jgi:hypothetical protein